MFVFVFRCGNKVQVFLQRNEWVGKYFWRKTEKLYNPKSIQFFFITVLMFLVIGSVLWVKLSQVIS